MGNDNGTPHNLEEKLNAIKSVIQQSGILVTRVHGDQSTDITVDEMVETVDWLIENIEEVDVPEVVEDDAD